MPQQGDSSPPPSDDLEAAAQSNRVPSLIQPPPEEDDEFLATSSSSDEDNFDDDDDDDLDFSAEFPTQQQPRRQCRSLGCILALTLFALTVTSFVLLLQAFGHTTSREPTVAPNVTPAPDSSRSPSATLVPATNLPPSTTPSQSTPQPTPVPVVILDNDSPVVSFSDPRYGSPVYNVSSARRSAWNALLKQRIQDFYATYNASCYKSGDDVPPACNQQYDAFCSKEQRPPTKYPFPPTPWKPLGSPKHGFDFDPAVVQRHLRQYRHAVAEYYEMPSMPLDSWYPPAPLQRRRRRLRWTPPAPPPTPDGHDKALWRLADKLRGALRSKRLVLGFMGSSVMSGQDNCVDFNYSNLLKRQMQALLAFAGVEIEARNMGQNGDGPDMFSQMLCAPDTMGALDVLFVWYPMIPGPRLEEGETFLHRQFLRGVPVHSLFLPWNQEYMMREGWLTVTAERPWVSWTERGDYARAWNWIPPTWGRHGDGRCHLVTREGAPGIQMQNWHFGPLGFQVLVDSAVNLLSEALLLALDLVQNATSLPALNATAPMPCFLSPSDPSLPLLMRNFGDTIYNCSSAQVEGVRAACASGYGPRFNIASDLKETWYAPLETGNPFAGDTGDWAKWQWKFVKRSSTGPGREPEAYSRPELQNIVEGGLQCAAFPDVGDAFVTEGPFSRTDWLTFKMIKQVAEQLKGASTMRVLACNGSRAKGPHVNTHWRAVFGIEGQPVGEPQVLNEPNAFSTCHVVAKGVRIPRVGETWGFYLDWSNATAVKWAGFQTVALLGEER